MRKARLAIVGATAAAGAAYQRTNEASDLRRHSPPGRLVDVGGRRLHAVVAGTGQPAIVVETGAGALALGWRTVADRLSATNQVVAYDRAGYGWSDPPPLRPRTGDDVAGDLRALLDAEAEPGPYVLVGHSLGGLYVRAFAARYPKAVAGLVLVDPTHENLPRLMRERLGRRALVAQAAMSVTLAAFPRSLMRLGIRLGPLRGIARQMFGGDSDDEFDLRAALYLRRGFRVASLAETIGMPATMARLRKQRSLNNLPLAVVSSAEPAPDAAGLLARYRQEWVELHAELASLSSTSTHLVASAGGHFIHVDDPDAVGTAIRWVLDHSPAIPRSFTDDDGGGAAVIS